MPLNLRPPRKGKTPNFEIRGTYLGCRVEVSSGTDKRSVANKQRRRIEECIETHGCYPAPETKPDPGQPTFLTAAIAYLQAGGSRRYVAALIRHFGETPLEEIDQAAIDHAARTLHPDVAPVTVNGYVYTPVSAILHHAGIKITVKRPKGYKGKAVTRFLLPPDAFAIIEAANRIDPEMGRLLTFLLYTGCRIGEALALKWENVDLGRMRRRHRIADRRQHHGQQQQPSGRRRPSHDPSGKEGENDRRPENELRGNVGPGCEHQSTLMVLPFQSRRSDGSAGGPT